LLRIKFAIMSMDDTTLTQIVMIVYLLAGFAFLYKFIQRNKQPGKLEMGILYTGLGLQTASLIWRWVASYQQGYGHAPLSNRYESMVFFSWSLMFLFVLLERKFGLRRLGGFAAILASGGIAATSIIPGAEPDITPLMPALKSNWLFFHVFTCFLAYSAFAVGCIAAIYSLIIQRRRETEKSQVQSLDITMYRMVMVGFLLLSMGIITGSAWAYRAWGRYWGWDPKEVWSLITWIVYAIFLHARVTKGWGGKKLAWIAVIGFFVVLFTFFGVNYLSIFKGLHSYA
jgi:cytochrome c-type biogenesis protein CcsB